MRFEQVQLSKRGPIYSLDNWTGHQAAEELGVVEGLPDSCAPLPPCSHDMHKVIEHRFGTLAKAFPKQLWYSCPATDIAGYKAVVERIMYGITPATVRVDVMYHANILAKGGDWADRPYR
jgi:hypothetical protein